MHPVEHDFDVSKKLPLVFDHDHRGNKKNEDDHDEYGRQIDPHRFCGISNLFGVFGNNFARMLNGSGVFFYGLNAFFHVSVHLFDFAASGGKKHKQQ